MEKLKINVHPTFLIFACILIYFGKSLLFFNYLFVMLLHELSHAFVARRLGYNIKNIKLIPFGICLNMNSFDLSPKDEIKISLAGPLMNFVLMLFTMAIWWIIPSSYNYTNLFCYANFITGVFNLIPAFPLDGGRILLSYLKQKVTKSSAVKFCKILNLTIIICLLLLFIWSCFTCLNITYILVIFCLLSGIFENNKMQKYSLINYGVLKKVGKILKSKALVVYEDVKLYKVCKYIDNFSLLQLTIIDKNKNVISVLTEAQFLKMLETYGATSDFSKAYKSNI